MMNAEAPATFYAATAVPRPPRPRLMGETDTNICIVGGGFAGLWTAHALTRRGYDVVVLEGRRVAGEASGRNGGFVSAGYAERLQAIIDRVGLKQAKALYQLSRDGIEIVRRVLAEGVPGVEPIPGRLNVQRYDDEEGIRREAELLAEHFDHEMLFWPTERVREALRTERYYQALHDADAFAIHPLNLALALAAEIERHGGRIYENTVVTGADLDGVRKWVATESGRVRAHQVVFCGSAFIGDGFPALERTILPISTYVCVTEPMPERIAEAIRYSGAVMDTRRASDYYRIVGDRLLWGGRITTRTRPPRQLARVMARDMASVYPQLKGANIEYAWSGIMGYAIHKMPQIGQLRPGVWVATAFGGHGLNTTAIAGELVASGIIDHDERWRLFIPFGLVWAGGAIGRHSTQFVYWGMQIRDKIDETRSRLRERHARRRAASAAPAVQAAYARKEAERRRRADEAAKRATAQAGEKTRMTSAADDARRIEDISGEIEAISRKIETSAGSSVGDAPPIATQDLDGVAIQGSEQATRQSTLGDPVAPLSNPGRPGKKRGKKKDETANSRP